jgi:hypothetical protein
MQIGSVSVEGSVKRPTQGKGRGEVAESAFTHHWLCLLSTQSHAPGILVLESIRQVPGAIPGHRHQPKRPSSNPLFWRSVQPRARNTNMHSPGHATSIMERLTPLYRSILFILFYLILNKAYFKVTLSERQT